MVGYKSISELSLKECYDMLQNEHDIAIVKALEQQYKTLLPLWQERDTLTFAKCRTLEEYENYLQHFDVYYYHSLYGKEAREAIDNLKSQNEKSELFPNSESSIEENDMDPKDESPSFATSIAWGCLWAIIAPILYFIVIAIINS